MNPSASSRVGKFFWTLVPKIVPETRKAMLQLGFLKGRTLSVILVEATVS